MLQIPLHNGQTFTLDKAIVVEAGVEGGRLRLVVEDGMEKRWALTLTGHPLASLTVDQVVVTVQMQIHVEEIKAQPPCQPSP